MLGSIILSRVTKNEYKHRMAWDVRKNSQNARKVDIAHGFGVVCFADQDEFDFAFT